MVKYDMTTKQGVWAVLSRFPNRKMNAPEIADLCRGLKLVPGIQHNTVIKNLKFLRDEGYKIESEYPDGKQNKVFWVAVDKKEIRKFRMTQDICECELSYFVVSLDEGQTWACNVCGVKRDIKESDYEAPAGSN